MFSCEFCKISKNNFFIEHLWWLLLYIAGSFLMTSVNEKASSDVSVSILTTYFAMS